jgi:hypothetical protein
MAFVRVTNTSLESTASKITASQIMDVESSFELWDE